MHVGDVGHIEGPPRWVLMLGAAVAVTLIGVVARPGVAPSHDLRIQTDLPAPSLVDSDGVALPPGGSCGVLSPIAAAAGIAYPPGHPDAPIGGAEACYPTMAAARADGYGVAHVPQNVDLIGGIYLTPIADADLRRCVALAGAADFPIPCLGVRPSGGFLDLCAGNCVTGGGYLFLFRQVPAPSRRCFSCIPDVVVASAPVDGVEAVTALTRCGPNNAAHPPWRIFFCDQQAGASKTQSHAGNTMLRGRRGDTLFAVSAGGRGPNQVALVRKIVDGLVFVRP